MKTSQNRTSYINPLEWDLLDLIQKSRGIATGIIRLRRPLWKDAWIRSMLRSLKDREFIYVGDGCRYFVTGTGERALQAANEPKIVHVQFRTTMKEAA